MKPPQWLRAGLATATAVPLVLVMSAAPAAAQPTPEFTAEALTPVDRIDVIKAPTSRLAQTDETLLELTGSELVPVVVKLDHDSVAAYGGEVEGYEATSPAVTGEELSGSAAERRYEAYLARREADFRSALAEAVPAATIGQSLRTVYGGVAVTVPADRIGDLLEVDGVAAVQENAAHEIQTDSSIEFIGADALYPQLGGDADAGRGTIIGVLDTGGWPEHPSFADLGNLDAPPGPARECNFGPDPTSDDDTPFQCNNKLIGGMAFLETYQAVRGDHPFPMTARDADGHGTHVGSTAAGNPVAEAPVFGVDHGPIQGVAPGAWVMHYRVCGSTCYAADSAAAVAQAVIDGVDVINFSIGGGANPFTDPVSLAFLDAYAAGVFVAASAGNSGPGAGTTNHVAPWITTVAASTQTREFATTLTLTADSGESLELRGTSITAGVAEPTPVVMAEAAPYSDPLCLSPAPAGLFDGVIVACERGANARVDKSFNVLQGGAVGMVLYNPTLADVASDNHYLPTVHLADGTDFVAFMAAHDEVAGSFPDTSRQDGQGDVMAAFSSRGPGGLGIKPDITAPGVQILAGESPVEGDPADGAGPAGEFFKAINGTSMSSPHIAGSGLLLRALHPDWTPGQIRSALMTTAEQDLVKEDLVTPADPFDYGSGRVDLAVAGDPGLTLDETPQNMVTLGADPLSAIHLNLPSINAPVMPGRVTTTRTVTNVTGASRIYEVSADAPAGSRITVSPSRFTVQPGASQQLRITVTSTADDGEQRFGEIRLTPRGGGVPPLHLPVGFVPQQGTVTLESICAPSEVNLLRSSTCTITAVNEGFADTTVDLRTVTDLRLPITSVDGARYRTPYLAEAKGVELTGAAPTTPALSPGSNPAGGWLPMAQFGAASPIGDESARNFEVPEFVYGGRTYSRIGVVGNGYLVVGGATGQDILFEPPGIPNPAPPNNVLAPFWTDLDGSSGPGIRVLDLTDGVSRWLVVEWEVPVHGGTEPQIFQVWLGLNGVEDISFAYDPANLPTSPYPFEVGAENADGSAGDSLGLDVGPTGDLVVTSSDPAPGGTYSYQVRVNGLLPGTGAVTSSLESDLVPGTTVVSSQVRVRAQLFGR